MKKYYHLERVRLLELGSKKQNIVGAYSICANAISKDASVYHIIGEVNVMSDFMCAFVSQKSKTDNLKLKTILWNLNAIANYIILESVEPTVNVRIVIQKAIFQLIHHWSGLSLYNDITFLYQIYYFWLIFQVFATNNDNQSTTELQ